MEIKTIKNYKKLAEKFRELSNCDKVKTRVMNTRNHYHFELIKEGINIAVVCYNDGEISVSPFSNLDNCENSTFLPITILPVFDTFIELMNGIKKLVVEE